MFFMWCCLFQSSRCLSSFTCLACHFCYCFICMVFIHIHKCLHRILLMVLRLCAKASYSCFQKRTVSQSKSSQLQGNIYLFLLLFHAYGIHQYLLLFFVFCSSFSSVLCLFCLVLIWGFLFEYIYAFCYYK